MKMNCVEEKSDEATDICLELQNHLLNAMLRMRDQNICPTCALYAISITVANTFSEQTSCDAKDIMKAGIAGFAKVCNVHAEIVDEGAVH